jgi:GAF domain-containing protein
MECRECLGIFQRIGGAFNSPVETDELLELIARTLVEEFGLKGCTIRLLSRDDALLELVAAHGLSERFLAKGPVEADRGLREALDGKIVHVANCAEDSRVPNPQPYIDEGIVSVTTVPLASRGQVIGAIRLGTPTERRFSDQELKIIEVVASFCASAIIHSMFHQIVRRVTETIRSSLDLDERLRGTTRMVTGELRAKGCTIQLVDATGERLELRAAYGLSDAYLRTVVADPRSGAVAEALSGECALILDARQDPRIKYPHEIEREGIGSILYVPLTVRGKTIGVLRLYTHRPYEFSDDELHLMRAIGSECALAIQNAQMYAAVKSRYQDLVEDFHRWFDHLAYPAVPPGSH